MSFSRLSRFSFFRSRQLAGELMARCRATLGEDADYLEAIRLQERESGVEIRG